MLCCTNVLSNKVLYILEKTAVKSSSLHEILWLKGNSGDYPD